MSSKESSSNSGKVGIYVAIALVIGNMIGSGIFLLPSSLAEYGGISIIGWVLSAMGAVLVALVFSRLSRILPKTGGPYVYTHKGYGDFTGFLVGWGYWISVLCTNAAIAVAFAGYLSVFVPQVEGNPTALGIIAICAIWFLTWLNARGVKSGGIVQVATTILKIIPLLAVSIVGIFYFNPDYFRPFNLSGESNLSAIASTVTITLFAYLGIESATIPAGNVINPTKTIPRATLIGTGVTIIIYMISSVSVMGIIPPANLVNSSAPFADAAQVIWGDIGMYIVGFGALVSTFGTLNGWLFLQGHITYAMAGDDLMPPIFRKLSKRGYPLSGILVSSAIVTLLVVSNYTRGLVEMFTFLILLSTFTALISYLFSSLAEVLLIIKAKPENWKKRIMPAFFLGIPTFAFSLWAIYGSGANIVFSGFIVLVLGTPFYIWSKIDKAKK